jgi:hypothetical protein
MDDKPVAAAHYAAFNAAWALLVGGLLATTRGPAPPATELPLFGLASFTLTKALAREKVGTWVREPLVDDPQGERTPKGTGLRYVAGELITCTRCLGTWSSLGLVGLRIARPREGRVVASLLATAAINDFAQAGFQWTTSKANAARRQAAGE